MTPLLLLAEKVEGLEGPDREVDGDIWWAMRSKGDIDWLDPSGFVRRCIQKDGSAGIALQQFFDSSNPSCLAKIAFQSRYTASVDDAMTLVPDGYLVALVNSTIAKPDKIGRATSMVVKEGDSRAADPVEAATLPLALVAASLRARAAMEAGE